MIKRECFCERLKGKRKREGDLPFLSLGEKGLGFRKRCDRQRSVLPRDGGVRWWCLGERAALSHNVVEKCDTIPDRYLVGKDGV